MYTYSLFYRRKFFPIFPPITTDPSLIPPSFDSSIQASALIDEKKKQKEETLNSTYVLSFKCEPIWSIVGVFFFENILEMVQIWKLVV